MSLSKKKIDELRKNNPDIVIPENDLKIDSFNRLLDKSYEKHQIDIKYVKKQLRITDIDIAKMFGYANAVSYRNSERKPNIENGIVELFKIMQYNL